MEPNSFGLRLSGCRRLVFILFVLGIPGLPLGPSLWAQEDDGDNPQSRDHGITEIVARIWTDKENQQVNAIFRAQQGNRVKVEKYNGEIVSFSYDALIPEDQQYLDEVVEKFGAAPGVRTWTDTSGNRFRGFFLTIDKSEIEFLLLSEEKIIRVESIFISQSDIDHILRDLDKYRSRRRVHYPYRSWSYRDVHGNQLMSLGKYKELAGENLVLTQRGEVHRIPLSRLSDQDLEFIVTLDPGSEALVAPFFSSARQSFRKKNLKDRGSVTGQGDARGWVFLAVISLAVLVVIALRYVHQSGQPEWDDEF